MVAFANKITPTEVAYFLIQHFHNFSVQVDNCKEKVVKNVQQFLKEKEFYFSKIHQQLVIVVGNYNHRKEKEISHINQRIQNNALNYFLKHQNALQQMQTKIELLYPDNILKRGYSITMKNGKALRSSEEVAPGEEIVTKLYSGEVVSVVK
jgi:exodeoxyribonuclease VII large subunit